MENASRAAPGASARDEISRLRDEQPRPLAKDTICRFTRHARAITRTTTIPMRAAAIRTLDVLLADAGPEGWCWRSPGEIQTIVPRSNLRKEYSLATILRSLNELHAAGLISWRYIPPGGRFPLRVGKGKDSRVLWNRGRATQSGGRVFMINLDAFQLPAQPWKQPSSRAPAPVEEETLPPHDDAPQVDEIDAPFVDADVTPAANDVAAAEAQARDAQGEIMCDRGTQIIDDRPSDLLRSLSETPQSLGRDDEQDPAQPEPAAHAPAALEADASPRAPREESHQRALTRAGNGQRSPLDRLTRAGFDAGNRDGPCHIAFAVNVPGLPVVVPDHTRTRRPATAQQRAAPAPIPTQRATPAHEKLGRKKAKDRASCQARCRGFSTGGGSSA
jgi:hypothetical protein